MFGMERLENWLRARGEHGDAGSEHDSIYSQWEEAMEAYSNSTNSSGLPQITFWMVIALPKKNFSENVELHPTLPMFVPTADAGELVGIATTREELDKITIPKGPGKHSDERWKDDPRRNKIFIVYKIKLQGRKAWKDLLEFCSERDMLTTVT